MISNFLKYLNYFFIINPYFCLLVIIIFLIFFIVFLIYLVYLILDSFYRPDLPQYPKNWFFDHMIPLILIFIPPCLICLTTFSLLEKILYILLLHSLAIGPLMILWSSHRNWEKILGNAFFDRPSYLLKLVVSIIYPAIWVFYFNIIKYLRIQNSVDFTFILNSELLQLIIIIVFLWAFVSVWLRLIIWSLLDLKFRLWDIFLDLLSPMNLYMLQFNFYFLFLNYIWKISFLFVSYISINSLLYLTKSKFQNLLSLLFFKPFILNLALLFFFCLI